MHLQLFLKVECRDKQRDIFFQKLALWLKKNLEKICAILVAKK